MAIDTERPLASITEEDDFTETKRSKDIKSSTKGSSEARRQEENYGQEDDDFMNGPAPTGRGLLAGNDTANNMHTQHQLLDGD